jgi:hypothetical protein
MTKSVMAGGGTWWQRVTPSGPNLLEQGAVKLYASQPAFDTKSLVVPGGHAVQALAPPALL